MLIYNIHIICQTNYLCLTLPSLTSLWFFCLTVYTVVEIPPHARVLHKGGVP